MKNQTLRTFGILAFLLFLLTSCADKTSNDGERLALTGGKIYLSPEAEPIEEGVILIENGTIVKVGHKDEISIPDGTKTIDCSGKVITSGFWNSHVHFMEPKWNGADTIPAERLTKQMQEMLSGFGFTHAFDIATLNIDNILTLKKRTASGEVKGPTVFTTGVPFTPEEGSPFYIAPFKLPEISTAAEAGEYVKRQLAAGADAIKLWAASPNGERVVNMPIDIVEAATREAHSINKPVFAHPTTLEGAEIALKGGVDILSHVAADDRIDWRKEMLDSMITSNMAITPTLKLHIWETERAGLPTENSTLISTAILQLRSFYESGGQVLFGTDVGYMTDYDLKDEYRMMSEAGMDYRGILASLTTNPAKRFGFSETAGKIAEGMDADLVILNEDPSKDVLNFIKVYQTLRKGVVIYP